MVSAEYLVMDLYSERIGTVLAGDRRKFHARGRRHVKGEVCDLGDEQGLGRLRHEACREQPAGQV